MIIIKKLLIFIIGILIIFSSGSNFFPKGHEIEKIDTILVFGVDKYEKSPDKIEVTLTNKIESIQAKGNKETIVKSISETGNTVYEAEQKIRAKSDKATFLGYLDFFLIGEKAAQEDFTKHFDFLVRDHEMRFSPFVFIIKDGSAKELINEASSGELFISERLRNIINSEEHLGKTKSVNVIEIARSLDNHSIATVIPALKIIEVKDINISKDMPTKIIETAGYAIIKESKLVGYIDEDSAAGYNFLNNYIKTFSLSVKDDTGEYVGVEVVNAKTKIETDFNGDNLESVTFKTKVISVFTEQHSKENLTTEKAIKELASKQSELIKLLMEEAIKTSKEYKTDCFDILGKIAIKHPYKSKKIEEKWTEIYPDLKISVEVESIITRSYDITLPNTYKKEK